MKVEIKELSDQEFEEILTRKDHLAVPVHEVKYDPKSRIVLIPRSWVS